MNVPITDKHPGDFRIWCARKNEFVAANISAIILPRSVCSDLNAIGHVIIATFYFKSNNVDLT